MPLVPHLDIFSTTLLHLTTMNPSLMMLLLVLFKTLLIAGGTFYLTFVLCALFPQVGRFLVRLFGFNR